MPTLIERPVVIDAAGTPAKTIEEYAGRLHDARHPISIARMVSPRGWAEPGQRADFDEFTVVLRGALRVEHAGGELIIRAGQAVHTRPGEWVRYATPEGAEYLAVCLPAFGPHLIRRDEA